MKRLVAWFATNPVAANLLATLAIFGGVTGMLLVQVKPYPDFEIPSVIVSMAYPGAAPQEVEVGICQRIEDQVGGVVGIETVRTTAEEGLCTVRMDLFFDVDVSQVADEIQNRVRSIDTFPIEAERLTVTRVMPTSVVAELVVTGPYRRTSAEGARTPRTR